MEMALGQQSQDSEYEYMDTTMINAVTATPDLTLNERQGHLSPELGGDNDVNYDDDEDDDGLEISDLPSSFPISQLTTQSSSSPTVRFQAIKQAMQEKFLNREISFHLPLSSFADDVFFNNLDGQKQEQDQQSSQVHVQIQSSAPEPESSQLSEIVDHKSQVPSDNESEISLSESEFDSQITNPTSSASRLRQLPRSEESMSLIDSWDYSDINLEEEQVNLSRRYSRMAAYRAARQGTYEAWATACPMLSVGDNHTEKEIEL